MAIGAAAPWRSGRHGAETCAKSLNVQREAHAADRAIRSRRRERSTRARRSESEWLGQGLVAGDDEWCGRAARRTSEREDGGIATVPHIKDEASEVQSAQSQCCGAFDEAGAQSEPTLTNAESTVAEEGSLQEPALDAADWMGVIGRGGMRVGGCGWGQEGWCWWWWW